MPAMTTQATLTALAILVLLLLSAFFSASETALTAASRARMLRLARGGNKRAMAVQDLQKDVEQLLGTVLLIYNAVNILATALATSLFTGMFGEYAVAAATAAMTVLVILFAEVMPKTLAIHNPDRSAMIVGPTIKVLVRLLSPLTNAVQKLVRFALGMVGLGIEHNQPVLSVKDELRGTIELHAHEGSMIKPHRDMLGSILDLDDLEVSEVMVHRGSMLMIDAAIGAEAIVDAIIRSPYTRVPLWRDNPENILGVLHAKDVLRKSREQDDDLTMAQIEALLLPPWYVPDTTSLREQLNAFRARRSHFALVIDEYGALKGLVTLEDILEEIVGDIADEHDVARRGIRPLPDGRLIVEGTTTIRDLNRAMDWELSDEHATTVAGYVIHEAQTIPEAGQAFKFHGFKFDVLQKRRNQLTLIRITPPEPVDTETI
jgi:Mg2+/Co2+ transporter CorB